MRVMIVVWPLTAHLYPTLPVAWALQGAGHDVCVASHPAMAGAVTAAGLNAVSLGTPETMPSPATVGDHLLAEEHRERLSTALRVSPGDDLWATFSTYTLAASRIFHPEEGAPPERWAGVDALVQAARSWGPDLVLWDPNWPSGAVAARVCGAAQARLLWGHDFIGWAERLIGRSGGELTAAGLPDPVAEVIRPTARRYGVEVDQELLLGDFTIDPMLPDMRLPTRARTVPVRRIPYAGPTVVPGWLLARPERPRLALSLGTTQRAYQNDRTLVATLLEMVAGLDIEVIATLDEGQLAGREVPDNVRTVDYLPLNLLLPTCSALVHHGGIGTLSTAVAHSVPHLIVGDAAAVAYAANARYVAERGAGLTVDAGMPVEEMRKQLLRVLTEPSFQDSTQRLQQDWLAMPSPNDIVPVLEKLTSARR